MPILVVENLVKKFNKRFSLFGFNKKEVTIVDSISFQLKSGEILGLLGPNGAGKTTTIQMLLSTMTPTSGKIDYFGKNFFTHRSEILQQVSFASTYVRLPGRLTIQENLNFYGSLYGLDSEQRKTRIEKFLKFFNMWHLRDREAGMLSAGETTRIMIVKAFLSFPKVVLLDEPTASLDPDVAHDVRNFVLDQRNNYGVSILFTSHNMEEVTQVCDRVLVLKGGKIIANNTPDELANSVSSVRVNLLVSDLDHTKTENYLKQKNLDFKIEERYFIIEVDEEKISQLLIELAQQGLKYTHISIDKPNLEDYFLEVAKSNRK